MFAAYARLILWGTFVVACFWYAVTTLTKHNVTEPAPAIATLPAPAKKLPDLDLLPLPGPKVDPVPVKKITRKHPAIVKSKRGRPVVSVRKKEDTPSASYRYFSGSSLLGSGANR